MKTSLVLVVSLLFICPLGRAQSSPELEKQLSTIDSMPSNSRLIRNPEVFRVAVDGCLTPSTKTDFDTMETQLKRARNAPCTFTGVANLKGKADTLNGDLISYDPQKEVILFQVPLRRLSNIVHGLEAATPYDPDFHKKEAKELSPDEKKGVKAAGKADYLLFSVASFGDGASAYEAQNGFGAKTTVTELHGTRYDIAVNIGPHPPYDERPLRFLSLPMKRDIAATTLQYIDVKLYWLAAAPCDLCFPAGSVTRGTLSPTFDQPYDLKYVHRFLFASLVGVRLLDRRDGTVLMSYSGSK